MDGLPLLIVWLYLSLLCGYLSLQLDHRSETVLLLSGRILTISITGNHMGLCQNLASNSKKMLGSLLLRNLASVAWLSSRMTVIKFFLKESPQKRRPLRNNSAWNRKLTCQSLQSREYIKREGRGDMTGVRPIFGRASHVPSHHWRGREGSNMNFHEFARGQKSKWEISHARQARHFWMEALKVQREPLFYNTYS